MTRSVLILLALAALALPTAALASGNDVLRDCAQNGQLTRKYSVQDLKYAKDHVPADQQEYSDCEAIITAAYEKATAAQAKKATHKPAPSSGGGSPSSPPPGSSSGGTPSGGAGIKHEAVVHHVRKHHVRHPAAASSAARRRLDARIGDRSTVPPITEPRAKTGFGALPVALQVILVILVLAALGALALGVRRWRRDRVLPHGA